MLDAILESVRRRLPALAERGDELRAAAAAAPPPQDFTAAIAGPGMAVIGEVKRRSPSAGLIAAAADPGAVAASYVAGGAAAVSVVTEPEYFGGAVADLEAVRAAVAAPLLRKDFIIHPSQVWEARACGADAVLLIVAALSARSLAVLIETTATAGMAALVEVHTAAEAELATAQGAGLVGVNSRDLATFEVDLDVAVTVGAGLAPAVATVAESGVSEPVDVARLAAAGFDAVLVGEALLRHPNPARFVAELKAAGQ